MKEKEELNKFLMKMGTITISTILIMFLIIVTIVPMLDITENIQTLIIIFATVILIIECLVMLKLEQLIGYYECNKCKHKHIAPYKKVLLAPHIGRTRYMKCPKCNKKSWNKKVLTK